MAFDLLKPFQQQTANDKLASVKQPTAKMHDGTTAISDAVPLGTFDDEELLDLWERLRRESIDNRWVFERQWHRNILYTLGRQWIEYFPRQGGWKDKRMAPWIPRPVTNKCKETVQAIRAMFTSIKLGVNVRPNGSDPANISAAATADDLAPLLHEDQDMDTVLSEFDFWLIVTGNAFLHTFLDYDIKYGVMNVNQLECTQCHSTFDETVQACPTCGSTQATPAIGDNGQPLTVQKPQGKVVTIPLSPLELAFPNTYARFSDVPYAVRLRWRTKRYFQDHPVLKDLVPTLSWQKTPSDQSMQLFYSLSTHNDLGVSPAYLSDGATNGNQYDEGLPEYEVWYKPCDAYPQGLVFRVVGEKNPLIIHLEDTEAVPGPFPYQDAEGNPLFTFASAGYEHVGGRIFASGPLDLIIQKQDQLNQLDSMIQLIIMRMSNPVWLEPKGAEIEKLTGMPGLVIKWNPLTVGGQAKPERIPGVGPDASLFTIREQYLKDIEELAGTFDIIKGAKPTGVEAFSALQLLVERSQSRFSLVFSSRGKAYRDWFKFAIELEREFGPNDRTKAIFTPARTWQFQNFKRAQLQGSVSVQIEDGTAAPKTSLGMRAALEHANQLGMLNMQDPDQRYEGLKLFGLTRMSPTLDINVQSALQKQQAFEQWAAIPANVAQAQQAAITATKAWQTQIQQVAQQGNPNMPMPPAPSPLDGTPLKWHVWYDAQIHLQEFVKWANGDAVRQLLQQFPNLEGLLQTHFQEMETNAAQQAQQKMMMSGMPPPPGPGAPGAATPSSGAMANSNKGSTSTAIVPQGHGQQAQGHGPA